MQDWGSTLSPQGTRPDGCAMKSISAGTQRNGGGTYDQMDTYETTLRIQVHAQPIGDGLRGEFSSRHEVVTALGPIVARRTGQKECSAC